MSAESVASSAPEPAADTPSVAPQVDVTALDDKNLGQYRHSNERWALAAIVIGMVAVLIGLWLARPYLGNILDFLPSPVLRFLGTWLEPTRLGLVLIGLLALAAVMDVVGQSSRSVQLVAEAVEVTPTTFPQLAPIVDELRKRFDLPRTRVYVSRDAPLTGYTIGVREPFAIVFSSIGVGSLTPNEFKFALGSEMGSIKLGHTLMAVLLGNASMSLPQPFSFLLKFRAIIFRSYHHAQTLSCDRIGVVATRDVTPALTMLIKQNLGQVRGSKVDMKTLMPQTTEIRQGVGGAMLKLSVLLSAKPLAVARLAELVSWAGEPPVVESTGPAKPAPPTPAASAAAAAKSAAEAAASAAAAVASAAQVAAAAALLAPEGADDSAPQIAPDGPSEAEPASVATAEGGTHASAPPNPGNGASNGASTVAATAPDPAAGAVAVVEAPPASVTPAETSPVNPAATTPIPAPEPSGTSAPTLPITAAPEGGAVSVTAPQPPQREGRIEGGSL